jgi:hypothetical protein
MRIAEMSPRSIAGEPVEIDLAVVRWVPPVVDDTGQVVTEAYWQADPAQPVGLLVTNGNFAQFTDAYPGEDAWLDELLGVRTPSLEVVRDDDGNIRRHPDSDVPVTRQRKTDAGVPLWIFGAPKNRSGALQKLLAICLHRSEEQVGAAMIPGLLDVYLTSFLIAVSIGRGLDPTTAQMQARQMAVAFGADLDGTQIREVTEEVRAKAATASSDTSTSGSELVEPSPTS